MTTDDPKPTELTGRRTLGVAAGAHVVHDGYSDLLYLLLPVWQAEFGLGYAEVGLLRGCYMGAMSLFQIPAAHLAERVSPIAVLAGGTLLASACFLVAGLSAGSAGLLAALLIGGIGASVQHPIASAMVAGAFDGTKSRAALGFYNFSGDIGKVALPAATAALLTVMMWRPALWVLAGAGVVSATLIYVLAPQGARRVPCFTTHGSITSTQETRTAPPMVRSAPRHGFALLFSISLIDSAVRMGFLMFLPFLLQAKGASLPTIGLGLSLVFAGGAAGKLVCGYLGARLGVLLTVILTEGLTTVGILALAPVSLDVSLFMLPAVGLALNGTSSVLYGTVPELVEPERRTRAFGIFYTGTTGAAALAPIPFGILGDTLGISVATQAIALVALLTIPLAVLLNARLPDAKVTATGYP
jgi:MFS transporter, FSR family, fosmidomycin resistance protein